MSTESAVKTYASAEEESKAFIWKVYGYMSLALAVTGAISWYLLENPLWVIKTFYVIKPGGRVGMSMTYWVLLLAELGMVFAFVLALKKVRAVTAGAMLLAYAAMNGLTLSPLLLLYTKTSIASTFFISGGMFASFSAFGFITKKDLSSVGAVCGMMVWGLIIAIFVNYFWLHSTQMQLVVSCIGVVVFAGLTMYDTQKIKQLNVLGNAGTEEDTKEALNGALTLYLDFINMFLFLLRILGSRRN